MEILNEFISQYATQILYTILIALAGIIGSAAKKVYEKYINDKTKRAVVKTCVQAVEQLYKELHGEEKYAEVVKAATEMLEQKEIVITELELKMLIEAAVGEFNRVFEETTEDEKCE